MSRILAIDADTLGLFVASGTARKGSVTIDRATARPEELPALSAESAVALGGVLKELLKQAGLSPGPAVFLVGRDKLFLKEVRHPAVAGAEEPAIIRFQAAKELNENADDMAIDYLPIGPTPDGGRKSMVVFVRKDYLAAIKTMAETAGVKLFAVTPRVYAAAEAWKAALATGIEPPESPTAAAALIFPAGTGAEFAVVRGSDILFTRPIPPSAMMSESTFVGEVKRNLAVVNWQVPGGVASLYLAEADAAGHGWAGRLEATLPIPVRTFDPLAGTPAAEAVPAQYRGAFAAVVGAIRLKAVDGPLPINFITPRQPKAEPNKNRSKFLFAALAACVLFGGAMLAGLWFVDQVGKEYKDLVNTRDSVNDELNALTLNAKRSAAADEFLKHQVRLHDELYDWTDLFPDITNTKMSVIEYASEPLPSRKERMDEDKKKEQNAAYKSPAKPVGKVTFTIQAKDRAPVDQFVKVLSSLPKIYANVLAPSGGAVIGTGSTQQQYTVKAGIHYRNPDQFTRKMNLTVPKVKAKSADPDDEAGGPMGFPGFDAPLGGREQP